MLRAQIIVFGLLMSSANSIWAQENTTISTLDIINERPEKKGHFQSLKDLKNIKVKDLKVDANAAQPDAVKDPLQPLNRSIYAFNDTLDRHILRPLAVQYTTKVPTPVRSSYHLFRKNMGEPWNAVNQLIQGRPARAAKTLGRFTINTLTTLGFADPARRLGLETEDEVFGVTLGYYGVPSGPYVMLPFFGPSTFRDGFGFVLDSQARLQKYLLDDQDGLYWSGNVLQAVDIRSQVLDVESVLQGDKYAMIRDLYLQRKSFQIAEKKGDISDASFIDDETDNLTDVSDDDGTQ